MKDKLLRLVDCGFFDHISLPKVDSQEKTEALTVDPPSRPCGLSSEISFNFNLQFPSKQPLSYLNTCNIYFCDLALVKLSSKEVPTTEVKISDLSTAMLIIKLERNKHVSNF